MMAGKHEPIEPTKMIQQHMAQLWLMATTAATMDQAHMFGQRNIIAETIDTALCARRMRANR